MHVPSYLYCVWLDPLGLVLTAVIPNIRPQVERKINKVRMNVEKSHKSAPTCAMF